MSVSLAPTGTHPHLINDQHVALARFSRYLNHYHRLPRSTLKTVYKQEKTETLVGAIQEIVQPGAGCPVFCVHEDLVSFLYRNRLRLESRLAIPENPILDIIDKYRFAQAMQQIGLHTPRTYLLTEFDADLLSSGAYLCKGRMGNRFRNFSSLKGMQVCNRRDMDDIHSRIDGHMATSDVLVQEKLHQNDKVMSCCGFSVHGELVRHFQYVKLRQHPDEFGTGTFLKSIFNDQLLKASCRIIKHFSYTGIFEIEFLRDDDRWVVLEMNPRTWKSIHFATLCGQNMCAAYADYCLRGSVPEPKLDFDAGKTWVDLGTDIPMLFKSRSWKNHGYGKNTYFCVLNPQDPLPFIMEVLLAPFIALQL